MPRTDGVLRVTLVANPCDWLFRYHEMAWAEGTVDGFGHLCRAVPFPEFVEDYLAHCPGEIGRMFRRYEADSVIRCEDLPEAFVDLALAVGPDRDVDVDSECQIDLPKLPMLPHSMWDAVQRARVIKVEGWAFEEYDYW